MSPHPNSSEAESLSYETEEFEQKVLASLTEAQRTELLHDWRGFWARKNQILPDGVWTLWCILAGRGFGKTRTGAETVREWVDQGYKRIHLVGATASDARDVMVQGESGLLSVFPPHQRPLYEPSKRLITFHTGAVAITFSADEPERLRGPQCEAFWADELVAWRFGQDAWDNLMFGFRLGSDPRGIITTTPKPIQLLKDILASPSTIITRGSSYENRGNLAPAFFQTIIRKYEGTRLGRQELNAELLEDVPGALWTLRLIDAFRVKQIPTDEFVRIVVGVDPAVTSHEYSDDTGIVVCGLMRNGHVVVLEDLSCKESPLEWARIAISAYRRWRADRIVGEVNKGGDLVGATIQAVAPDVAFRAVRASRGKMIRAEPVAALYEQGRVHHYGSFDKLEDQMCNWTQDTEFRGTVGRSPDRMDAMVWAITDLLIDLDDTPSYNPIFQRVQISRF